MTRVGIRCRRAVVGSDHLEWKIQFVNAGFGPLMMEEKLHQYFFMQRKVFKGFKSGSKACDAVSLPEEPKWTQGNNDCWSDSYTDNVDFYYAMTL